MREDSPHVADFRFGGVDGDGILRWRDGFAMMVLHQVASLVLMLLCALGLRLARTHCEEDEGCPGARLVGWWWWWWSMHVCVGEVLPQEDSLCIECTE